MPSIHPKLDWRFPLRGSFLLILIPLLWLTWPGSADADQLFLTNGDRISGDLISFSPDEVRISTPYSGILRIPRQSVLRISTHNKVVVDFISGERIIGRVTAGEGGASIIQSDLLGNRSLALESIKIIQPLVIGETAPDKISPQPSSTVQQMEADLVDLQGRQMMEAALLAETRGKGSDSPKAEEKAVEISAEKSAPSKPIGQKPEDEEDIRKIFLRQSSVLLRSGQVEVEGGLNYLGTQSVTSVYNIKLRQFQLPLTLRIGLLERLEGFVSLAYLFNRQDLSFAETHSGKTKNGLGDTTLGMNYEIFREGALWPEIITNIRFKAPSGAPPQEDGLSLGSGHWAGSFGLQFIKTVDPVVLFWGLQYTHEFKARHYFNDGFHDIQPGKTIGYNLGLGFAVNEKVSLSAQVLGSYQWDTESEGKKLSGSSNEPVSFRSALTYRWSKKFFIEPSLGIGLNEDAPDFSLGLSATHRF
ncbi:MAG: transporter [Thermodesulfobacteriota bacterium]